MANADTTYTDSASGFIDVFRYFSGSTVTSESYHCNMCRSSMNRLLMYENKDPRIPSKVLHSVKTKVQPFGSKPSRNIRHIKQFIGHSFRIGNSKK
jgi:hypothetical protein